MMSNKFYLRRGRQRGLGGPVDPAEQSEPRVAQAAGGDRGRRGERGGGAGSAATGSGRAHRSWSCNWMRSGSW